MTIQDKPVNEGHAITMTGMVNSAQTMLDLLGMYKESRAAAMVITKIEEALMWAHHATVPALLKDNKDDETEKA